MEQMRTTGMLCARMQSPIDEHGHSHRPRRSSAYIRDERVRCEASSVQCPAYPFETSVHNVDVIRVQVLQSVRDV